MKTIKTIKTSIKKLSVFLWLTFLTVLVLSSPVGYAQSAQPVEVAAYANQSVVSLGANQAGGLAAYAAMATRPTALSESSTTRLSANRPLSDAGTGDESDNNQSFSWLSNHPTERNLNDATSDLGGSSGTAGNNFLSSFKQSSSASDFSLSIDNEMGSVSYSYPIVSIPTYNFPMNLSLLYNSSLDEDPAGLGTGVQFNIPMIINNKFQGDGGTNNFLLIMPDGSSHNLSNAESSDSGNVQLTDEPANGDYANFMLHRCTDYNSSDEPECYVYYLDKNGAMQQERYDFSIVWRNGTSAYLAKQGGNYPYEDAYDYKTYTKYSKRYFKTIIMGNSSFTAYQSIAKGCSGSSCSSTGSYVRFVYNAVAAPSSWSEASMPNSGNSGTAVPYLVPTLSSIISDTGTVILTASPSGKGQFSIDINGNNGNQVRQVNLSLQLHESPEDIDDNSDEVPAYQYGSTIRFNPNVDLLKITDTNMLADPTEYVTTFTYRSLYNNLALYPVDPCAGESAIDYNSSDGTYCEQSLSKGDGKNDFFRAPYSSGDSQLASVTWPTGLTQTVHYLQTHTPKNSAGMVQAFPGKYDAADGESSSSDTYGIKVFGQYDGVPSCQIDDKYKLYSGSTGNAATQDVTSSPYCDAFYPKLVEINGETGGNPTPDNYTAVISDITSKDNDETFLWQLASTAQSTPYASYISDSGIGVDAQSHVVSNTLNGILPTTLKVTSVVDIDSTEIDDDNVLSNYTGYPFVASEQYSADPLWYVYDRGAIDRFTYHTAQSDPYTGDKSVYQYQDTHLLTQQKSSFATGNNLLLTQSFDNYISGKGLGAESDESYNLPTSKKVIISNSQTHPDGETLKSVVKMMYTAYGNISCETFDDGSKKCYFYNYQQADTIPTFHHVVAVVSIPPMATNDDLKRPLSPQNNPAYYHYQYFTVTPKTNLVTSEVSGAGECEINSNNQYNSDCIAASELTQATNDQTPEILTTIENAVGTQKGLIASHDYNYDAIGRVTKVAKFVYDPNQQGTYYLAKMAYFYYATSSDDLSNYGIDPNDPGLTDLLSVHNPYYTVLKLVAGPSDGLDPVTQWSPDLNDYTMLSVKSLDTGNVAGAANGLDGNDNSYGGTAQDFRRVSTYDYDAWNRQISSIGHYTQRCTSTAYNLLANQAGTQLVSQTYYCPSDTLSGAQLINKSVQNYDAFGLSASSTLYHYANDGTQSTPYQLLNSYNYNEGGLLDHSILLHFNQPKRTTYPIYDASHHQIGQFSRVENDSSSPLIYNGKRTHTASSYGLMLKDDVTNTLYNFGQFVPCTTFAGSSSYCAKYLSVAQRQRVVESGSTTNYDVQSNRLIGTASYRYLNDASPGFKLSTQQLYVLKNSLNNGQNAQQLINQLLTSMNIDDQLNSHGDWKKVSQVSNTYGIYNQLVRRELMSHLADGTVKHKVNRFYYDKQHMWLTKTSNADSDNMTSAQGFSQGGNNGDADIREVYFNRNLLGNLVRSVEYDASSNTSTLSALDLSQQTSNSLYREQCYSLNSNGLLLAQTDIGGSGAAVSCATPNDAGNGNERTVFSNITYDSLGRPISSQNAVGIIRHIAYYPQGPVAAYWTSGTSSDATMVAAKPICKLYDFAQLNLKGVYYNADATLTSGLPCAYSTPDSLDGLSAQARAAADAISYTYDTGKERLTSIQYPDTKVFQLAYTNSDQLSTMTDSATNYAAKFSYYTNVGLLYQASLNGPNGVLAQTTNYYDNENDLSEQDFKNGGKHIVGITKGINSITTTNQWQYPANLQKAAVTISQVYDGFGELASESRSDGAMDTYYSYDALFRLLSSKGSLTQSENYDVSDNLTTADGNGDVLQRNGLDEISNNSAYKYDANGNMTNSPLGTSVYNTRNQLIKFISTDGTTYTYDTLPTGYRYHKSQLDSNGQVSNQLVYYPFAGMIFETDSWQGSALNQVAYHLGNMRVVTDGSGKIISDLDGQPAIQYLISSKNGSVLGRMNATVLAHYNSYGKVIQASPTLLSQATDIFDLRYIPQQYDSEYYDVESESLHMPLRNYSLQTYSFNRADPVNHFNQTNGFDGNPNDFTDPTGGKVKSKSKKFEWGTFNALISTPTLGKIGASKDGGLEVERNRHMYHQGITNFLISLNPAAATIYPLATSSNPGYYAFGNTTGQLGLQLVDLAISYMRYRFISWLKSDPEVQILSKDAIYARAQEQVSILREELNKYYELVVEIDTNSSNHGFIGDSDEEDAFLPDIKEDIEFRRETNRGSTDYYIDENGAIIYYDMQEFGYNYNAYDEVADDYNNYADRKNGIDELINKFDSKNEEMSKISNYKILRYMKGQKSPYDYYLSQRSLLNSIQGHIDQYFEMYVKPHHCVDDSVC